MKMCGIFVLLGLFLGQTSADTTLEGFTDEKHNALVRSFCEGKLDDVIVAIEKEMESNSSLPVSLLEFRARAYKEKFLEYDREVRNKSVRQSRGKTSEEKAILEKLANEYTIVCEETFVELPTKYRKSRLSAQWWTTYNIPAFPRSKVDSQVLRQGLIENLKSPDPKLRKKVDKRTKLFKTTFRKLLNVAATTKDWSLERKTAFSDSAENLFRGYAVIVDVPDERFEDILEDMPYFVFRYMPSLDPMVQPETTENTLDWYIWVALMSPSPGDIERKYIENQVREWSKGIENDINELTKYPNVETIGLEYAQKFMHCYEAAKENRFIPYFKHILLDNRMEYSEDIWKTQMEQLTKSWKRNLAEIDVLPTKQEKLAAYKQERKDFAYFIYSFRFASFVRNNYPSKYLQLPGKFIQLMPARLNDNWFWVFEVEKVLSAEEIGRGGK